VGAIGAAVDIDRRGVHGNAANAHCAHAPHPDTGATTAHTRAAARKATSAAAGATTAKAAGGTAAASNATAAATEGKCLAREDVGAEAIAAAASSAALR
jgi:hypothetical protein